jgi:hypothetical protein
MLGLRRVRVIFVQLNVTTNTNVKTKKHALVLHLIVMKRLMFGQRAIRSFTPIVVHKATGK